MSQLAQLWSRFWFEADGRAQIRVFRVGFALILFVCYAIRAIDLELYYSNRGLMPLSILSEVAPMDYRLSIFRFFSSDRALWIGSGAYLASLLALAAGIRPRVTVLLVWALHLSFVHRNLAIAYGVDTISCFFLLFLCFADFRKDSEYRPGDLQATLGSMAYRLFQVQVCIIYGYSGLKKLKGGLWWNGEALWSSLGDAQLARWDFSWLSHFPLALAAGTYATLAWEIYFPALIWFKPLRKPMLLVGIGLHLGIAIGLNLPFFAGVMVMSYVFFLDRQTIDWLLGKSRRIFSRRIWTQVPTPASD